MRYLITGGAGFIGSHLVDALIARGDDVLVLDDLSTGSRRNLEHLSSSDHVEFIEGTILDGDLVDDCMQQVDGCFHLASAVGVKLIVERPLDSLLGNIRGIDTVLSTAARRDKWLLFTSTSEIYGKNSAGGLTEDADRILGSPFKSRWAYATAKSFGEALAHSYTREKNARMVVVRLFNTVGPRQRGAYGMVLPRFVKQALAGEDLTVYGNGTQSRCFCHVYDTVHGITQLMDADLAIGNAYNIGNTVEVPIVELARLVIERTRSRSRIELVAYEDAYEDGFEELGRRKPDIAAMQQLTGWAPSRTIEEAIDDLVAYELSKEAATAGAGARRNLRLAG